MVLGDYDMLFAVVALLTFLTLSFLIFFFTASKVTTYGGREMQGGPKNGAIVFYCKYFENSTTELRGSWWTSAVLYIERSNYFFV